ncbi:hypothetical protein QA648_21150 (plasmid) [Rhizobium sp. CB3171]|uniref:hypothetical protein n=1 Tax=unclassified Rhizobium TaxID=2613769 RepID=UPI0024B134C1|nr:MULTISPECIES: hypothetical protein [unclassified Rhizobium]MDK4740269.1 hypothetical protein [Rhizobium sp. CNPSo 3464]WFU05687.1 hypothetical protein QA648_21150 [Rhizobium sp. CB3171]
MREKTSLCQGVLSSKWAAIKREFWIKDRQRPIATAKYASAGFLGGNCAKLAILEGIARPIVLGWLWLEKVDHSDPYDMRQAGSSRLLGQSSRFSKNFRAELTVERWLGTRYKVPLAETAHVQDQADLLP